VKKEESCQGNHDNAISDGNNNCHETIPNTNNNNDEKVNNNED
jgi:hypothetical protein